MSVPTKKALRHLIREMRIVLGHAGEAVELEDHRALRNQADRLAVRANAIVIMLATPAEGAA